MKKNFMFEVASKVFSEIAPCDSCNLSKHCKDNKTACVAFSSYVSRGRFNVSNRTNPTSEKYIKIFASC